MEQILAFVLGVSTVAFIWVVVVTFRTAKKVKGLEQTTVDIENTLGRESENIHRRISETESALYSHIDSRLDRLEAKITKEYRQVLKG